MKQRNLLIIEEAWRHFSQCSGLNPLISRLSANRLFCTRRVYIDRFKDVRIRNKIISHLKHVLFRYPLNRYNRVATFARYQLQKNNKNLVLLTAGEYQYCEPLLEMTASLKKRLFILFHQPPSWLRVNPGNLEKLDGVGGVFCFGTKQMEYIQSYTSANVFAIKHGVELDFFKPAATKFALPLNRILFVGSWLRDFELLYGTMSDVWAQMPGVTLACVVPLHIRKDSLSLLRLARDSRVQFFSNLSSAELLAHYHYSSLLLMPLVDAVANNAILESIACGKPVVASRVGDCDDYARDGVLYLCDNKSLAGDAVKVLRILENENSASKISSSCREFAVENFNWDDASYRISEVMLQSY